jgi:hypothetical protein
MTEANSSRGRCRGSPPVGVVVRRACRGRLGPWRSSAGEADGSRQSQTLAVDSRAIAAPALPRRADRSSRTKLPTFAAVISYPAMRHDPASCPHASGFARQTALASLLSRFHASFERGFEWLRKSYAGLLKILLTRRAVVPIAAALVLALGAGSTRSRETAAYQVSTPPIDEVRPVWRARNSCYYQHTRHTGERRYL